MFEKSNQILRKRLCPYPKKSSNKEPILFMPKNHIKLLKTIFNFESAYSVIVNLVPKEDQNEKQAKARKKEQVITSKSK